MDSERVEPAVGKGVPTLVVISETRIPLYPLHDLDAAMKRNRDRGYHYFDADTTRFFKARYHDYRPLPDGSLLMVESTKRTGFHAPDGDREYRVCRVMLNGETRHYKTLRMAGEDDPYEGVGRPFKACRSARADMLRKVEEFKATGVIAGES